MIEVSQKQNILSLWFFWHFAEMAQNLLKVWNNYFLFTLNYFSIPLLLKTFLSPWRRYIWKYPRGFISWQHFETFISNLVSRVIGAIIRFFLILFGIFALIFVFILGLIIFLSWILLPVLLVLGLAFSLWFLI